MSSRGDNSRYTERTDASSSSSQPGDAARHHNRMQDAQEYARMVKIAQARKTWMEYMDSCNPQTRQDAMSTYQMYGGVAGFSPYPQGFTAQYGVRESEKAHDAFLAYGIYDSYIKSKGNDANVADAELDKYEIRQEAPKQESAPDRPSWRK